MQDKRYTSGYEILQVSASRHKKKELFFCILISNIYLLYYISSYFLILLYKGLKFYLLFYKKYNWLKLK